MMLTEERQSMILDILSSRRSVGLSELCELLGASESTVRRDLAVLDESGLINKVRGGAMALESFSRDERNMEEKLLLFIEEKTAIARYAASLIEDGDMVFIDAGTTTGLMIDHIPSKSVIFVTNAFVNAKKLAQRGFRVLLTAGEIKVTTEAAVGAEAVSSILGYNFTKCFIGVNGVSMKGGCSTPDPSEASVKAAAISRSRDVFVLADHSKFGKISSARFAELNKGIIITDKLPDKKYLSLAAIKEVL